MSFINVFSQPVVTSLPNRDGSRISSLGVLALIETIRYNNTNDLNKQYFTVLMKTVLLYEVIRHNYLLKLQKLVSE